MVEIQVSQLLVSFISALFGAALGGAVSWGNVARERKMKLTLSLYEQFHSADYNHWRIAADAALARAPSVPEAYAAADAPTREAISTMVHFWERVALLLRAGALHEALLRRFLGQYARWWSETLCRPQGLDDPEWGQTLRDIQWLFGRLSATRRSGQRR